MLNILQALSGIILIASIITMYVTLGSPTNWKKKLLALSMREKKALNLSIIGLVVGLVIKFILEVISA